MSLVFLFSRNFASVKTDCVYIYMLFVCLFCFLITGAVLTLIRPVFNDTDFVGVFYTSIPFSSLISNILDVIVNRPLSYVFVLGSSSTGLLHPLLPGDSRATANASMLEPEGAIESYLSSRYGGGS